MDVNETTEADRFAAETGEFHTPGTPPEPKTNTTDKPDGQGNADTGANADDAAAKGEAKADNQGGAPAAGADAGGDEGGKAADAKPEAGKGEGGEEAEAPAEGEIPAWMKKRLERSKRTETAAETRAREAEERAQAAEEKVAALEAASATPATAPDPDDYETTAEYEAAKTAYKKATAAPAAEKPKKAAEAAPTNPLGITNDELLAGVATLETSLPPTVAARLKDASQVQFFPAPVLLEIADEPDATTQAAMARFVIGNQKQLATINRLPARSQAAAFIRAFKESATVEPKKVSKAPAPIDPANTNDGRDERTSLPALASASFEDFEKAMDDYDRKRGAKAY